MWRRSKLDSPLSRVDAAAPVGYWVLAGLWTAMADHWLIAVLWTSLAALWTAAVYLRWRRLGLKPRRR